MDFLFNGYRNIFIYFSYPNKLFLAPKITLITADPMTMSLLKIFFILIFSINGTVNINKQNIIMITIFSVKSKLKMNKL